MRVPSMKQDFPTSLVGGVHQFHVIGKLRTLTLCFVNNREVCTAPQPGHNFMHLVAYNAAGQGDGYDSRIHCAPARFDGRTSFQGVRDSRHLHTSVRALRLCSRSYRRARAGSAGSAVKAFLSENASEVQRNIKTRARFFGLMAFFTAHRPED